MAGNLPMSLVTVDDLVWDQLMQMDAPLGSPVSSTVAGVAPVQTWEYTEQVLPDIGDVDNKILAAAGMSNTILISTTTKEVLESITVSIGENGNWFVGNEDTGVAAAGTSPGVIARPTGMYRASLITQVGNLLTIAAGAQFVTSSGGAYHQFATTADVVVTLDMGTTLLTIDRDGIIREYPAGANLWLIPESEAVVAIAVDSLAVEKTFVMPTVHNAWAVAGASRTFTELAQTAALTAESFAAAAGTQAVDAAASASLAEEWASKPENSAITGNPSKYSALHWAMKAQQWAGVVSSALIWKGGWSAAMNTAPPTPALGTGAHFYRIKVAGTISGTAYAVGDYIHWDTIALVWFKIDGTDAVTSVNGKSGAVILNSADVGAQPADATLTALTNQVTAADRLPYFTGVDTAALTPLTAFARSLLDDANATIARETLGAAPAGYGVGEVYPPSALNADTISGAGGLFVAGGAGSTNFLNDYAPLLQLVRPGSGITKAQLQITGDVVGTRYQSGSSWGAWNRLYGNRTILGAVSQSGGIPTGAIIERGSNANGEYVKFADGTMICTASRTFSFSFAARLQNDWALPAAHAAGVGSTVITSQSYDGGILKFNRASPAASSVNGPASGVILRLWATGTDSFAPGDVSQAIPVLFVGRWF